jgi:lipopolysaccharide heptosyltransferase I
MRVLIVKLGSIGDIVHTLPALAVIRRRLPDAEIGWAVEERSAEILRGNPMIDRLIEVDTRSLREMQSAEKFFAELRGQLAGLRQFRFDIALDLQGLLKSAMIAKLSGARRRIGFGGRALREPASRVFLTRAVRVPGGIHVIKKNLTLVSRALHIPVSDDDLEFPINTTAEDQAEADAIAARAGDAFAILNPAGGWVTKLWPAENYGHLAAMIRSRLGMTPVVVTGPDEGDLAARVSSATGIENAIFVQPSLKGFVELARRAAVYVGGDTGPTHLALAAGAPVVGIFGPTEWWRNGSISAADVCVERTDIPCRVDCHRRTCGNWICMDIDVETVFSAVEGRLVSAGRASKTSAIPSKIA